jgi:isopenicillin N synthase-like dioxygenase
MELLLRVIHLLMLGAIFATAADTLEVGSNQLCNDGTIAAAPPVIDVSSLFVSSTSERRQETLDAIGKACVQWGFFQIINHSISPELIERTREEMRLFFQLPLEEKLKIRRSENNSRGFANDELTKQKRDWKEIFDFGNIPRADLDEDDPSNVGMDGRNRWPDSPMFKATMKDYYEANVRLAQVLMDALAESLHIPLVHFRESFKNHTSFARLNYYPQLPSEDSDNSPLGISRHTDAGGLTVLWQDGPGLQVYSGTKQDNNDGKWVDVTPLSTNAFTINIGDMVHVWTGGKCHAPEHRVIANPMKERYSIPFFFNPSYDTIVKPLPGVVGGKQKYREFSWGTFREARFAGDYADVGKESQIEDWEIRQ